MTKLWQKSYSLNEQVERFEAAQNSALDARLIRHDVWGSLAHAAMLFKINALAQSEHIALKEALCSILQLEAAGEFTTTLADEDVHTRIENYLVAVAGDAGKKIHLARSRNDQVLVDLRLYGKEQLHEVAARLCSLSTALLELASKHSDTPMPGYTHMQRAMLSSVGLWAASFAEALFDDERLLSAAYALNDSSPLGSAAGYGVPLAIDRQYCADRSSHCAGACANHARSEQASPGYPALFHRRIRLLPGTAGTLYRQQYHAAEAQPGSHGAGTCTLTDNSRLFTTNPGHRQRVALRL